MSTALTVANFLTILRLILIPVFVTSLFYQRFGWALAIFLSAAVTDGLDGLVARSLNQRTQLGAILDPMADKLLLVTAFIVLSLPRFTFSDPIPFWVTIAVISRDTFIVLGALVINMVTGFSQFRPSLLGKVNTIVQIVQIVVFLTANAFNMKSDYLTPLYYLTVAMAVLSGLHYIVHVNRQMSEMSQVRQPSDE